MRALKKILQKIRYSSKKDKRGYPRNTYGSTWRRKYGRIAKRSFNKMQKHY